MKSLWKLYCSIEKALSELRNSLCECYQSQSVNPADHHHNCAYRKLLEKENEL